MGVNLRKLPLGGTGGTMHLIRPHVVLITGLVEVHVCAGWRTTGHTFFYIQLCFAIVVCGVKGQLISPAH